MLITRFQFQINIKDYLLASVYCQNYQDDIITETRSYFNQNIKLAVDYLTAPHFAKPPQERVVCGSDATCHISEITLLTLSPSHNLDSLETQPYPTFRRRDTIEGLQSERQNRHKEHHTMRIICTLRHQEKHMNLISRHELDS